jgi:hypothetical protein
VASGDALTVKSPFISVIIPVPVPFTKMLAPITGSPLASTTRPVTVPVCITACTSVASAANTSRGLPAMRTEVTTVENKILFDENFKNSLFIIYKFKINTIDII